MYRLGDVTWFKPQPINSPNAWLVDYLITDTERCPFAIIAGDTCNTEEYQGTTKGFFTKDFRWTSALA